MKKRKKQYRSKIFMFVFVVFLLFVIALGNKKETIITYNVNNVKSIEAVHIVSKYSSLIKPALPTMYESFEEAISNGPNEPVSFIGTMTGYGPDCVGCGGKVGCPPRQDVRNGNIYFNDNEYGTIRIVATDKSIPCGSIVRISNFRFSSEPIIAIALDHGGAIVGNTMDLLYASEAETKSIGRQKNIQFDIIRWGW